MHWLHDHKIQADLNQGLDFRLVTDENLEALSEVRHYGPYTFAFDDLRYKGAVTEAVALIRDHIPRKWGTRWYLYYHPKSYGGLSGLLERAEWCREHQALPYIMRDAECWSMPRDEKEFLWNYTSYCNQPMMFKGKDFLTFVHERCGDSRREEWTVGVYERLEASA